MRGFAVALAGILAGCAPTIAVQYVDASGRHGAGNVSVSGTLQNGRLSLTSKGETCSGAFANWSSLTVVVPLACTSGLTGTATMTRPFSGPIIGEGTMQLSDGTSRRFTFSSLR